jgi:zinc transport system ATP-binding protein
MRDSSETVAPACGQCCTRVSGLTVRLGGREILSDVGLHMHCGELTVLIGPNGAGKTTLLKALLGEIPSTGETHFVDLKIGQEKRPRFGYVPQRLEIDATSPFSVLDLFAAALTRRPAFLGASPLLRARAIEALDRVESAHIVDRRIGALSGGELQRVLLALAIEPLPTLLLLDEPLAHVDRAGMELFHALVADLRRTHHLAVLMVSHDLPLVARHADRVILLDRVLLRTGAPAEVFADPRTIDFFGRVPVPETAVLPPKSAIHNDPPSGGARP